MMSLYVCEVLELWNLKARKISKNRKKSLDKIGFDFLLDFWQKCQNAIKSHKKTKMPALRVRVLHQNILFKRL